MHINWTIRNLESQDQDYLWDMLYLALWDAPDEPRRPRSVLDNPKIKRLVEEWGRESDLGFIAVHPESLEDVGAVWARLDGFDGVEGFGCDYPFLGIAVQEQYQGMGVGSFLLSHFIHVAKKRVDGLRLGVNAKNTRAIKLYKKFGFETYATGPHGYPQMKLIFTQ